MGVGGLVTDIELEIWELRQRCATAEAVCAVLLAKLAIMTHDPTDYLQSSIAELQGLATGLSIKASKQTGASTESVTASMNRVCLMAESILCKN
jgi:hypothetical protein